MLLQTFAQGFSFLTKPVHSTLFPFPLAPTIHAARISIAYQTQARAANGNNKLPWPTYIVGYLIMSWGGLILTHELLRLPPPILYTLTPYQIYIPTHLFCTFLFTLFPDLLNPATSSFLSLLDTLAFPIDCMVRTGAVTGAIAHLQVTSLGKPTNSLIHPSLPSSPLTHLIIGALAASGGSLAASTFSTWSTNWSFSTPPVLRAPTLPAFLLASMDVWGGALAAAVYGTVTGHPAFKPLRQSELVISLTGGSFKWTEVEARALCAIILTICSSVRVYKLHWAGKPASAVKGKKKEQ